MQKRIIKPLLGVAPVVALAMVFAATATAGGGGAKAAKHGVAGVALGKAQFTIAAAQDERLAFFAKDRGAATRDRGFVVYRNVTAGVSYDAKLDCVAVDGGTARIGYVIPDEASVPASLRGVGIVIAVVDSGKNSSTPDAVGYVSGPASIAADCDDVPVPTVAPIRAGKIMVRTAKADRPKAKPDDDDDGKGGAAGADTDDSDDSADSVDTSDTRDDTHDTDD